MNANDYFRLRNYFDRSFEITNNDQESAFYSKYKEVQNRTAALVTTQAQAFCLQEVKDEERPFIKTLKERNFEIVHFKGNSDFDTAIALDKKRFVDIKDHSIEIEIAPNYFKDVAIASATDVLTGEKITFVSAHTPGFSFDSEITHADAKEGDFYCESIIRKLSEIGNGTMHIIGADMNANPEKWNPRFNLFSNQGFRIHRQDFPTNVNPKDITDNEREIDFIFTRTLTSIWQKLKSIFVSTVHYRTTVNEYSILGIDYENNASDHLPVIVKLTPTTASSKIIQLWNYASASISSFISNQNTGKA